MAPEGKRGVDIRPAQPRAAKSPRSATRPCNRHTGLGCPYVHLAISNISKMKKKVFQKWKIKNEERRKNEKFKKYENFKNEQIQKFKD